MCLAISLDGFIHLLMFGAVLDRKSWLEVGKLQDFGSLSRLWFILPLAVPSSPSMCSASNIRSPWILLQRTDRNRLLVPCQTPQNVSHASAVRARDSRLPPVPYAAQLAQSGRSRIAWLGYFYSMCISPHATDFEGSGAWVCAMDVPLLPSLPTCLQHLKLGSLSLNVPADMNLGGGAVLKCVGARLLCASTFPLLLAYDMSQCADYDHFHRFKYRFKTELATKDMTESPNDRPNFLQSPSLFPSDSMLACIPSDVFDELVGWIGSYLDVCSLFLTGDSRLKWAFCRRLHLLDDFGVSFRWPFGLLRYFVRLEELLLFDALAQNVPEIPCSPLLELPHTVRKLRLTWTLSPADDCLLCLSHLVHLEELELSVLEFPPTSPSLTLPPTLRVLSVGEHVCPSLDSVSLVDRLPSGLQHLTISRLCVYGPITPNLGDWSKLNELESLTVSASDVCDSSSFLSLPSLTSLSLTLAHDDFPILCAIPASYWDTLPKQSLRHISFTTVMSSQSVDAFITPHQLSTFPNLRTLACSYCQCANVGSHFDVLVSDYFQVSPPHLEKITLTSWNRGSSENYIYGDFFTREGRHDFETLPSSLTTVIISTSTSNLPSDYVFPQSLKSIVLENAPVSSEDTLDSMETTSSPSLCPSPRRLLPSSLEKLRLSYSEQYPVLDMLLPETLTSLDLHRVSIPEFLPALPSRLRVLSCQGGDLPHRSVAILPATLQSLTVFGTSGPFRPFFESGPPTSLLPSTLTSLVLFHMPNVESFSNWLQGMPATWPLRDMAIQADLDLAAQTWVPLTPPRALRECLTLQTMSFSFFSVDVDELRYLPRRLVQLKLTGGRMIEHVARDILNFFPTTLREVALPHPIVKAIPKGMWTQRRLPIPDSETVSWKMPIGDGEGEYEEYEECEGDYTKGEETEDEEEEEEEQEEDPRAGQEI